VDEQVGLWPLKWLDSASPNNGVLPRLVRTVLPVLNEVGLRDWVTFIQCFDRPA
jgi:hypothetical protein